MPTGSGSQPFMVDLLSKSEYYPYGMVIDELSYNLGNNRYGFGGTHEMDNEVKGGVGNHLSFGDFGYDTRVGRRFNLDPIDQVSKSNYVTFANNPIYYSDPTGFKEYESMDAYKKATKNDKLGEGDWLTYDRENDKDQWKNANLFNLQNQKPFEYTDIDQRRDFYNWFQGYSKGLGFDTKWAGAARGVANAILWGDRSLGILSSEIDDFNDAGNQLIFMDVFPKLKELINGPILKGIDAKSWDAKTLKEEQYLVQYLYEDVTSFSMVLLKVAATGFSWAVHNDMFPLSSDLNNTSDRWKYGMSSMGYSNISSDYYNKVPTNKSYIDGSKASTLMLTRYIINTGGKIKNEPQLLDKLKIK